MKSIIAIVISFLFLACVSINTTEKNQEEDFLDDDNRITITQPESNYKTGPVYIDDVTIITSGEEPSLLISGNLPESCSNLYSYHIHQEKDSLHIEMKSWRPTDAMCLQALQSFTFLDDSLSVADIHSLQHWSSENNEGTISKK